MVGGEVFPDTLLFAKQVIFHSLLATLVDELVNKFSYGIYYTVSQHLETVVSENFHFIHFRSFSGFSFSLLFVTRKII